jgi:hypothetical protein
MVGTHDDLGENVNVGLLSLYAMPYFSMDALKYKVMALFHDGSCLLFLFCSVGSRQSSSSIPALLHTIQLFDTLL